MIFDPRPRVRLGRCTHTHREVGLSTWVVDGTVEWTVVEDTLRHELAHVLAGPRAGHGRRWKVWCARVGARPVSCQRITEENRPPPKWRGVCSGCGAEVKRHRRTKGAYHRGCGPLSRIVWEPA